MPKTRLSIALGDHPHTQALRDGRVGLPDHVFDFQDVTPIAKAFRRMVREAAYDVSEMAASTYLLARAHGVQITALPVFLTRGLHHGAMVRAPRIAGPKALEGRRVAVNRGYTVTTSVWARAILALEHGLDLSAVTWVPTGEDHLSGWRAPANVTAPMPGADIGEMLARGDVVAATGLAEVPGAVLLIDDPQAAAIAAVRRGFYPINHLVVVRDAVLASAPDLPNQLFEAFAQAKRLAPRPKGITDHLDDPIPYGLEPNRRMLDELIRQCVSQRILVDPMRAEELFPRSVSDLVA